MDTRPSLATAHLLLRLRPLNGALRAAVLRQKSAARVARPDLSALCVTEEQVELLLDELEVTAPPPVAPATLTPEEQGFEDDLRARSRALGAELPLDALAARLELTPFEQEALLLCAAPEISRGYERIYAFVLDDLNRRQPCIELLCSLTAASAEERISRQHALGSHGRLRASELLLPAGEAPIERRQELRLADGVFEFLTGGSADLSALDRDRAEIGTPLAPECRQPMNGPYFQRLCRALREGQLTVLGVWGPRRNGSEEFVLSLAAAASRPVRRLLLPDMERLAELAPAVDRQLRLAAARRTFVWFDADSLVDGMRENVSWAIADAFVHSPAPILVTGEHPWRPLALLHSGAYAEILLPDPGSAVRAETWSRNFPELERAEIESLATRYHLGCSDIHAVSTLARTHARLAGESEPDAVRDRVGDACAIVTRRSSARFAVPVIPKRTPEDLILPEALHRQVLEVARFFELQSRVDDDWGFGRLAGGTGTRVLFTGDPGTGKTLSAEVIAGILGLSLYKVDLARVVSKWVGETEKNLDTTFREAEESHSVLFFDEAEALFGKRGEVQSGTDRYANLEVSYLLQRLDASRGLVILASNVRDQIDAAFVRRFQIVVHFPRPAEPERRRIWQAAFPASAPVDGQLDLGLLARLEMTGAAIVNAARNAALLAADSKAGSITPALVIQAIARQYHREARVLTPNDLGAYGTYLQGGA